jgi:hypothetical protein
MGEDFTSFERLKIIGIDFEAGLLSHGIRIKPGSVLENILFELLDLVSKQKGLNNFDLLADYRPVWREVMGIERLAKKFNQLRTRPGFGVFVNHLNLLNEASISQTSYDRKDKANKLFELWMGLLAFELGTGLVMDNPFISAPKKSPDIVFNYKSQQIAIECKVPGSRNPRSHWERIEDAVNQIEASNADWGFVAMSARNLLDHDQFWPFDKENGKYACYRNAERPSQLLGEKFMKIEDEIKKAIDLKYIYSFFKNKKAIPNILLWLESVCALPYENGSIVTAVGIMGDMSFGITGPALPRVFGEFNRIMHSAAHEN